MGVLFATQDIGPKERFDFWHDVVCRTYALCLGSADKHTEFAARIFVRDFGGLEISEVTSTPIRYERRLYDLKSGPRDDIFVSLMVEGTAHFVQNGKEIVHGAGDVLIYDAGRPYSYHHQHDYRSILLRAPRPVIEARLMNMDCLGGFVLKANSSLGRLVGSLIHETYDVVAADSIVDASDFSPPTLDVVAAAVRRFCGEQLPKSSHRALLQRIQTFMKENLTDEYLTLENIAREQNVSVRTLSRLFAETGTTPMGWLQNQRLARAFTALSENQVNTVTEAAFAAGFSDLSHFSRSFKRAYGRAPHTLLLGG